MSRPASGKMRGTRPLSGHKSHQAPNNGISYEDMLVAQYLDELRKSPQYARQSSQNQPSSPYLQKLAHTHIVPTPNLASKRPQSAHVGTVKGKIDAKFIDDHDLWDPVTPTEERKKRRPFSAPVYKRPLSATYGGYNRPTSAKSAYSRSHSLYKRQPHTIVVTAFKNGNKDVYCRVAAPNIKMLLEYCTEKMSLSAAARRVFLGDGTEVFTPKDIPRDADVYISIGEQFKNPFKPVKDQNEMSKNATWTMNGLVWTQDAKRKKSKTKLSKRFRSLIEQSRRRVLVFRNGHGSEGTEIVADPDRFEDFLVACTAKLDMGTYARFLYDWEGREIARLDDAPVLDQCLQTWSTPVLGPLWVSKGEGFSPKGVEEFLKGLITYTQAKLKEAKHYKEQLQHGQSDDTKDKVEIVAILSMSESEIEETLDIVAKDIEDFSNALNHLKEQRDKIQSMLEREASEGYDFKLKHIEKFDSDHRMVGRAGLRLKVFENGTYEDPAVIYFNLQQSGKGAQAGDDLLMIRLLDQCSTSTFLSNPKKNPAIRPVAKKLYNEDGQEIKSVWKLEFDQEVWLSFGEPFKTLHTYVLSANFDSVSVYNKPGGGIKVMKEPLRLEDVSGKEKSSKWESSLGLPPGVEGTEEPPGEGTVIGLGDYSTEDPTEAPQMAPVPVADDDLNACEIQPDGQTFLRSKENPEVMMCGNIVMDIKKSSGNTEVWPADAQSWVISKAGYIYSKAMPQLVLAVLDVRVSTNISGKDRKVEGLLVGLQKKQSGSPNQQWKFTEDARMSAMSHPGQMLTYLGAQLRREETQLTNEDEEGMRSQTSQALYLAVCEKLSGKDAKAQRWALKQERYDNLGQWKYTQGSPEWHKNAYSWPVKEDGQINENYDWPMEGFIIPNAPPLKAKKEDKSGTAPLRVLVMKNGVRDVSKAVSVVGPDLTNMRKDVTNKDRKETKKSKHDHDRGDTESIDVDMTVHCDEDLTVLKLEFILFLERSTAMLDLPFAARRLFDESGKEHFSLSTLRRDQLVYVSCGESWSDPNLSKAEQQRRYLLSNLSSDVEQIRQFIALRDPENLVLEVECSLVSGARLVVNECAVNEAAEEQRERAMLEEAERAREQELEESERKRQAEEVAQGRLSAHEIAHQRADERLNKLKWPWERVMNGGYDNSFDEDEQNYSNKELYRKFKMKPRKKREDTLMLQKFIFEDGFIICAHQSQLVLGIKETEGRVAEVILVKKRQDDINQRWILQENGTIQAKHNPQMVLTVSLPSSARTEEDGSPQSYTACGVTIQSCRQSQFGRANQRWLYDENTGFIRAFHTDKIDKEITAANKANVCTYSVMGDMAIDQPGYVVMYQDKGAKTKKLLVCSSCARAMRGRHKLEKVQGHIDFACSMGNAKEQGVKQIGSFQCLNGKVDLSTFEAQHTLEEWEGQLEKWREELSVRVIAREISAAKVPYTVKVLAYKNGDGRLKPGQLVVGSSVPGILEQCTSSLGFNQAARRLYTADGTLVLDTDDLVDWVREEYVRDATKQLRAEARARKKAAQGDQDEEAEEAPKYLDKVDLDSDMDSSEEEDQESTPPDTADSGKDSGETKRVRFKDIVLGYSPSERSQLDPWSNVLIIPNPLEPIPTDGHITAWKLYARKAGQICLQVLRPSGEDPASFFLTGQVTYNVPQAGEQLIDIQNNALTVRAGDIIGFYSVSDPIVPYDVVDDHDQSPFYLLPKEKPKLGQMLSFETWLQSGTRKYSLSALFKPAEGAQIPPSPAPPPKKKKVKKAGSKKKGPKVEPPPVDMVLRYPIEVWVSSGENFIQPQRVEQNFELEQKRREERAAVSYELEKEKHVLRQMQGRRYDEQNPGTYKATRSPYIPVLKEGHWQDPTLGELQRHDMVHQLETHLAEMRAAQKPKGVKTCNANTTKRLYTQPAMKRVLVFPNGESLERAQYVWGETIAQIRSNATTRLNLRKPAKILFALDGTVIDEIETLERDQIICASPNRTFLRPKESKQVIEIKANWGRARKQYGRHATDIIVTSDKNPEIDVDPFGPSKLAGGPSRQNGRHKSAKSEGV